MSTNNRIPIKWVRDKAKSAYIKANTCYICASTENLELHHLHSMTRLLETWITKKGYSVDNILSFRDEFITEHTEEIYKKVYTLCSKHHTMLHSLYGSKPAENTVPKQEAWLNKKRDNFRSTEYNSSDRVSFKGLY